MQRQPEGQALHDLTSASLSQDGMFPQAGERAQAAFYREMHAFETCIHTVSGIIRNPEKLVNAAFAGCFVCMRSAGR